MQLITHRLVPPSTFPSLPVSNTKKYVYRLGLSFCPSMDLIATYPSLTHATSTSSKDENSWDSDDEAENVTSKGNDANAYLDDDEESVTVDVWRFNGQRVFSVTLEGEETSRIEVRKVDWRDDGRVLAILTSDGFIRLLNSFSGKVVHRFSSLSTYAVPASPTSPRTRRSSARLGHAATQSKPTALAYAALFSNPTSTQALLQKVATEDSIQLDDLLGLNADVNSLLQAPANLPRELANIDVESFLPRLSCLPPVGFGREDIFSTRASVDAIFHSHKKTIQSGTLDVLMAGHNDGIVNIRIFDAFELGGVDMNSATGMRKATRVGKILRSFSWPFAHEIYILAEDTKRTNLHLLALDMKPITHSSTALPTLAIKATQLRNLLQYLSQIQSQLAQELKTAYDLPTRFLKNLNEDLEKQDGAGASFATAAYHAAVTGEVSGALKEWFNDQLGERGVKRWEKSVSDCLELVRRLTSEAWCPGVERAGVVVSRLSGLSNWPAQSEAKGSSMHLDRKLIEAVRDTIDVMAIRGEECLRDVVKEMSGFVSFIKWLKWEVEASSLEDTSERLDEMREASEHGDIMKVLGYIDQGPQESVVKHYLVGTTGALETDTGDEASFYNKFKQQKRMEGGRRQGPAFDQLLARLRRQCDLLFEQIAKVLRQGIMARYVAQLNGTCDKRVMDVRITPPSSSRKKIGAYEIHVVARQQDHDGVVVHQMFKNDKSSPGLEETAVSTRQLADGEGIMDIKFVDDLSYLVLARADDKVRIYSHPIEMGDKDDWELRHDFQGGTMEAGMKPASLTINGRKNRRVVGVVDEDGKGYAVFDLDSGDTNQEQDHEDEMMSG